jgi:hypothetical protein
MVFCLSEKFVRSMPGRLLGATVDSEGKRGFVLTLATRDNIYGVKRRLRIFGKPDSAPSRQRYFCRLSKTERFIMEINAARAHDAHSRLLAKANVEAVFGAPFVNEFAVQNHLDAAIGRCAGQVFPVWLWKWYPEQSCLLVCATEMNEAERGKRLSEPLHDNRQSRAPALPFRRFWPQRVSMACAHANVEASIAKAFLRDDIEGFPELGELEVLRHFTRLATQFSIGGFYAGSCTMKYNPKINEVVARFRAFRPNYPLAGVELLQGALELLYELERILRDWRHGCGELADLRGPAGLMLIRALSERGSAQNHHRSRYRPRHQSGELDVVRRRCHSDLFNARRHRSASVGRG